MALVWTIAPLRAVVKGLTHLTVPSWPLEVVILLVAFRLLQPPVPQLAGLSRIFEKCTTLVVCSGAIAGAAVLIVLSRH